MEASVINLVASSTKDGQTTARLHGIEARVCKKCGTLRPVTEYKHKHGKKCKACQSSERKERRRVNGYNEKQRQYMRLYRAGNPDREMITIINAVQKSGGLFMRHPGVLKIESIKRLVSSDLRPDEVVMLKEELSIMYHALDGGAKPE